MYAGDMVRIVQVGTADEAWILRPEWHAQAIADMTAEAYWHNAPFDAQHLEQSMGLDCDETMAGAQDTEVLSRLLDPRPPQKGGIGHGLGACAAHYLGLPWAKKEARTAMVEEGRKLKIKAADIWRQLPVDNEPYLIYAGQDVFLTARLAPVLSAAVAARGMAKFARFEKALAGRIIQMQRKGMAFDPQWASRSEQQFDHLAYDAEHELENTWDVVRTATYASTSAKSLVRRFEELGVKPWPKMTAGGKRGIPQKSLDKEVLSAFALMDGDVRELAQAVLDAKRNKHYGDYIRGMRDNLGRDGRVHPNVRPMQAATARMSISDPPLQQLPRQDKLIRGCLIAEPGETILCVDYAQVEFRVAAAVSQDKGLIQAILDDEDLHSIAATAMYGPGYTKEQRNVGKGVGFGYIYMGRAKGIRQQMIEAYPENTPSLANISKALRALHMRFPRVAAWGNGVKRKIDAGNNLLVTATGRQLLVDLPHAGPNYAIQSPARDIFAAGINEIHKRGLGDMLRLVVHDETVLSVPAKDAEEISREVADAMSTVFKGVPIVTEAEIKGERWTK
jgi:DNA polymerase-1